MCYTSRLAVTDNLGKPDPGTSRLLSYLPACHAISLIGDGFISMNLGSTVYFADANALKGSLVSTRHLKK